MLWGEGQNSLLKVLSVTKGQSRAGPSEGPPFSGTLLLLAKSNLTQDCTEAGVLGSLRLKLGGKR